MTLMNVIHLESPIPTSTEQTINYLGTSLMRRVVATGVMDGHTDHARAVRVMRKELKSLIMESEDPSGRYVDHRAMILAGNLNAGYVLAAVTSECIMKIEAERKAANQTHGS